MKQLLILIKKEMQNSNLWESVRPDDVLFESTLPFHIDTLSALQWLQWVFIPKIEYLLANDLPLPATFTIAPYFEEALKEESTAVQLLDYLRQLDKGEYSGSLTRPEENF